MDIHLSLINLNNYSQHLLTKSTFKVLTDEQLTLQLIKSRTSHSRSSDRLILASQGIPLLKASKNHLLQNRKSGCCIMWKNSGSSVYNNQ